MNPLNLLQHSKTMARLLLKCHDVIGKTMAGPAIRYWEFAKALSHKHQVTLLAPNQSTLQSDQFKILSSSDSLNFKDYDVLITQLIDPKTALLAKKNGVRLVYDAYDPEPLEHLEIFKSSTMNTRSFLNQKIIQTVNFSLKMADGVLCANQKQRDLWTGSLLSLLKIHPQLYDRDPSLNQMVAIVPFGISSNAPAKEKEGFRKMFKFKESDKLLIWGGGIWNWFDPLTLISAIKILSLKRNDIKLVFMGLVHPNAATIPAMSMAHEAQNMAKTLGLMNQSVFFNETWIPYEERGNYLLEADLGVSTHFEHLETRYSFRTRLLDYIWANLPIVATNGDTFGELIEKHQIGRAVPPNNAKALAEAIESIVDDPKKILAMKENLLQLKQQFFWETVIEPIEDMVGFLIGTGRANLTLNDLKKIITCAWCKLGPYALFQKIKIYLKATFKNGS